MARFATVASALVILTFCIAWDLQPSAQADEKADIIAGLEKELGEVRRQIAGAESKIKLALAPSDQLLDIIIDKAEREISYYEDELKKPATKDKEQFEKSLAINREALAHFKGIRVARKLGKNKEIGEIGAILEQEGSASPYATKHIDPIRKELAKLQDQERQLAEQLARITGKPLPVPAVAGDEKLFKPNRDDYATFVSGVAWNSNGERGVLRILPGSSDDPIAKGILMVLGLDKALTFSAVKRGPEYVVEGDDYLALVKKAAQLVSDSNTTLVFETAKMTLTPIDDDMMLAIHLAGTITATVDGQPKTTKLGLDKDGNPSPIKFLLKPDVPSSNK